MKFVGVGYATFLDFCSPGGAWGIGDVYKNGKEITKKRIFTAKKNATGSISQTVGE